MEVSLAGVIGGAVGLYIGWIDHRILKGLLQAAEQRDKMQGGNGFVTRHGAGLRGAVFFVPIVGFPVIGYLAGSQLVG